MLGGRGFLIGDRVHSVKIGRRDAFDGTVEGPISMGWAVRADDDGRLWHRDYDDITLLPPVAQAAE